jgi:excisionase family DNA binding protein
VRGYRTVQEFCAEFQIPVRTFYKWRENGTGPRAIRVGRWLRIPDSEIDRWLTERADAETSRYSRAR